MKTARAIFETIMSMFAMIFIGACCATIMYVFIIALINGNPSVRLDLDLFMEFKPEFAFLMFLLVCFLYKLTALGKMMFAELDIMFKNQEAIARPEQRAMVESLNRQVTEMEHESY